LNLLLWSREDNLVGLDVELDPKDVLHLMMAGRDLERDRGQTELRAWPLQLCGPGWIGDRYV
jgi:hypothetical protein